MLGHWRRVGWWGRQASARTVHKQAEHTRSCNGGASCSMGFCFAMRGYTRLPPWHDDCRCRSPSPAVARRVSSGTFDATLRLLPPVPPCKATIQRFPRAYLPGHGGRGVGLPVGPPVGLAHVFAIAFLGRISAPNLSDTALLDVSGILKLRSSASPLQIHAPEYFTY
jgi:hypothetical protein